MSQGSLLHSKDGRGSPVVTDSLGLHLQVELLMHTILLCVVIVRCRADLNGPNSIVGEPLHKQDGA